MADRLSASVPIWLWVAGLGCGLVGAAGCGDASEPIPGAILWERSLEVEHPEPHSCLYLTVERDSDSVVVLGDARLRAFDAATGHQRWSDELTDCQQVWDDAPGIGSVRRRYDAEGRELERFSSELGLIATRDSNAHPIALGNELVKLDRDRTPLWRQSLLFELGSPRASSVLVDAAHNVIISSVSARASVWVGVAALLVMDCSEPEEASQTLPDVRLRGEPRVDPPRRMAGMAAHSHSSRAYFAVGPAAFV